LNSLIPKFRVGGKVQRQKTKEEAKSVFNKGIIDAENETTYLFASSIGESAYEYFFIEHLIKVAVSLHENTQNKIFCIDDVYERTKTQVIEKSGGKQNPIIHGKGKIPFVVSII
jgi:predicted proteasome-type protease